MSASRSAAARVYAAALLSSHPHTALAAAAMSQPQSSQASSSSAGPAGLGLMSSMSPECTPLKHRYDACFHSWLVDYLALPGSGTAPAAAQSKESSSSSMWGRGKKEQAPAAGQDEAAKRQSLKERLDGECGGMWEEYRKCVTVSRSRQAEWRCTAAVCHI